MLIINPQLQGDCVSATVVWASFDQLNFSDRFINGSEVFSNIFMESLRYSLKVLKPISKHVDYAFDVAIESMRNHGYFKNLSSIEVIQCFQVKKSNLMNIMYRIYQGILGHGSGSVARLKEAV